MAGQEKTLHLVLVLALAGCYPFPDTVTPAEPVISESSLHSEPPPEVLYAGGPLKSEVCHVVEPNTRTKRDQELIDAQKRARTPEAEFDEAQNRIVTTVRNGGSVQQAADSTRRASAEVNADRLSMLNQTVDCTPRED